MDTLSLRVSSIKSSENRKKNSEIKLEIVSVPKKYQINLVNDDYRQINEPIANFGNGNSVEIQLECIKKISDEIIGKQNENDTKTLDLIQFLSDIYFHATIKHPLRNRISKTLQLLKCFEKEILECLVKTINENCQWIDECESVEHTNKIITSLYGYFENFSYGPKAMGKCLNEIFQFINAALDLYLSELKKPLSPAAISELLIFIHNTTRLLISSIQLSCSDLSMDCIQKILDKIQLLFHNDDVPMDTKVNGGIFIVQHSKLYGSLEDLTNSLECPKTDTQRLCICIGLINLIDWTDELCILNHQILDNIVIHLVLIANHHSIEQSVLLAVCRGFDQLSKRLLTISPTNIVDDDQNLRYHHLLKECLNFAWSFGTHCMDSVRHLCRDLLKNLLKLSQRIESARFLQMETLSIAISIESPATLRCLALESLSAIFGTEYILNHFPNGNRIILKYINELNWTCYEKLMVVNCGEVDTKIWYERWLQPILTHPKIEHDFLQVNELLIGKAITVNPNVIYNVFAEKDNLPIETYLFIMWTVRKNGQKVTFDWTPAIDPIVQAAKIHACDDVRIMHLKILVDCPKSTQLFTTNDLNEIEQFLYYNCNCQSPAMRGKIMSYMTKMFNRFQAGYCAARKLKQIEITQFYENFLMKLIANMALNLFDGANFSRRSISLSLIQQTIRLSIEISMPSETIFHSNIIKTLVDGLNDTYEANKALIIDILKLCPPKLITTDQFLSTNKLKEKVISVKPGESLTAAYYLELCSLSKIHFTSTIAIIEWLETILKQGLNVAKQSLLTAAKENPLYGTIFCIRHLIGRTDFKVEKSIEWQQFFQRFIQMCKQLTAVVGPIVNSSSPEGHLPNDFSEVNQFLATDSQLPSDDARPNKILSTKTSSYDSADFRITSQMVLICAWRTVKEVSLLLGDIALRLPIKSIDTPNGMIRSNEILEIGSHFQELLAETKHRGAFEQAYVGFSKLCIRLWRGHVSDLHEQPMIWLSDLLNLIGGEQDVDYLRREKICATRRSAGIPFMIQALITSELQVCSSRALHFSMNKLFDFCRQADNAEIRTHSLNILRALFRCSDLGDTIAEYVSDGIECAILGYNAMTWPEKNSATLLFAALIIRIFGVQRTKDSENLNIRNRMTGRIFFLRYPRLYDFFSAQLMRAAEMIERDERPTNLHPLLLLLGRLYPSALEGSESNLQLSAFTSIISRCSRSPELETRRLAAKAAVSTVQPNDIFEHLHRTCVQFKEYIIKIDAKTNLNLIHGFLLQIFYLVRSLLKRNISNLSDKMKDLLIHLNGLPIFNYNYVIQKAYVDILIECLLKIDNQSIPNKIDGLISSQIISHSIQSTHQIGSSEATKSFTILKLMSSTHRTILFETFRNESVEYIQTILNIIALILYDNSEEIQESLECTRVEIDLVNWIPISEKMEIISKLSECNVLKEELFNLRMHPKYYPHCKIASYTILSKLSNEWKSFKCLEAEIRLCQTEPDEIQNALFKYILASLDFQQMATESELIEKTLHILLAAIQPIHSDSLRLTALNIVIELCDKWIKMILTKSNLLTLFVNLILILLRDDDSNVRDKISKCILTLTKSTKLSTPLAANDFIIIATYAEEIFLNWIHQHVVQNKQKQFMKPWLFWKEIIQNQLLNNVNDMGVDDIEIFDKNEANTYAEPYIVCRFMFDLIRKSFEINDELDVNECVQIECEIRTLLQQ